MLKHSVWASALLICFAGLGSYGQSSPLRAEIKSTRTAVRNSELFFVSSTIRNTSNKEQSIVVWACGYGRQWAADVPPAKVVLEDCLNNGLAKVRLKPDVSYERKVQVSVTLPAGSAPKQTITFRLGFASEDDPMAPPRPGANAASAPRLWSNAVTVTVTR